LDGGDHGMRAVRDCVQRAPAKIHERADLGLRGMLVEVDVGARGERPAVPAQDADPNGRTARDLAECADQAFEHGDVERIQLRGPIEDDVPDRALRLQPHLACGVASALEVAHRNCSLLVRSSLQAHPAAIGALAAMLAFKWVPMGPSSAPAAMEVA
jgi:hypothetical protein